MTLPVIDIGPLVDGVPGDPARDDVARQIDAACRELGFFYVVGHGIPAQLGHELEDASAEFFALDDEEKRRIAMASGGRAWRGWFPLGGELTSGVPDRKEGLYLGEELDDGDARVAAGWPLHGRNLFPERPPTLRPAVLASLDALTRLGHQLAAGVSLALGLGEGWLHEHLTADPLILFRIFCYPAVAPDAAERFGDWGVAEHTDYGLLTILRQDDIGGLEVCTPTGWTDAPPIEGSFVVNIGDMLDRMTGGRYRSTPHRVQPSTSGDRLSFPFFFDPAWDAEVRPIPLPGERPADDAPTRWDGASVHEVSGTYGDYLWSKVSKVFPTLAEHG